MKTDSRLYICHMDKSDGTLCRIGVLYKDEGKYYYSIVGEYAKWVEPSPSEDLPHFFAKRLPNKRRNDYGDLMSRLGLPADASDIQILSKTEGRIMADNIRLLTPEKFEKQSKINRGV